MTVQALNDLCKRFVLWIAASFRLNPSQQGSVLLTPMLFFSAADTKHGRELWATSGTPATTRMVKDINPGPEGSDPREFTEFDGRVYFTADSGSGRTLWVTDGTPENTGPVKLGGQKPLKPGWLTVFKNQLFFSAEDKDHGRELWSTNGRGTDTGLFYDVNRGPEGKQPKLSSSPSHLTVFGDALYFAATDGIHGRRLWSTDRRRQNTSIVTQGRGVPVAADPLSMTAYADSLYFTADNGRGARELWSLTGRKDNTPSLVFPRGIPDKERPLEPGELTIFSRSLYFTASNGTAGRALWSLSGRVKAPADPHILAIFKGVLYFSADDGVSGRELWSITGTQDDTPSRVKDISPGPGSSDPNDFVVFGQSLYFSAATELNGRELWSLTGDDKRASIVGSGLRSDVKGSSPRDFAVMAGVLYFSANFGRNTPGPRTSEDDLLDADRELGATTGNQFKAGRFLAKVTRRVGPLDARDLTVCDIRR